MGKLERFGVSMPQALAQAFDRVIREKGYTNRSEAIRDIIRNYLVEEQWTAHEGEGLGTVTLVYDHHAHDLAEVLTELQHAHHACVVCSQHVHLDEHNCLETIVLRGSPVQVHHLAETFIGTRGVKHGRLVCTTTGRDIV